MNRFMALSLLCGLMGSEAAMAMDSKNNAKKEDPKKSAKEATTVLAVVVASQPTPTAHAHVNLPARHISAPSVLNQIYP